MFGQHMLRCWSSTQAHVALSSGEAEYQAMIRASTHGLGTSHLFEELGEHLLWPLQIKTDATAAIGIASRRGVGKVRRIEVADLWLQEKARARDVRPVKVSGSENLADGLTRCQRGPGATASMRRQQYLTSSALKAGSA